MDNRSMSGHTEECDDQDCGGECREHWLECAECGESAAFVTGKDYPEDETTCCGEPMTDPGGCEDDWAAERRQLGCG